ncbi:unnamed protein product [Parnassius apollo]|uniref:(apollo) hypothetical protein n=1 Tax=Parnassius apollo TaxID=110799 RepID=A0A8S3Y798_PARAO|nr:unnamed protein product [Parnassius apollo]
MSSGIPQTVARIAVETETESDINSYKQPSTYESGTIEVPTADKHVLHSPITRRKQHIIQKSKLSPHCAKLYRQYRRSQRQLNFKTRVKKAVKQAMAIMKQSLKCYRFLQRIFILPSKYTINKMIAKLN